MPDPYASPDGETPGQRRARLLNLNNPKWDPDAEPKVDEVPAPEALAEPQPAELKATLRQPVKGK